MAYKLLFLLFTGAVSAQSLRTNSQQQFLNAKAPRNYVINSGAEKNDLGVTDADGIHSRTTSTPLKGDGSHLIDATTGSQSVVFLTDAFQPELYGRNCQASFIFNADAGLYTAAAYQNSLPVSGVQTLTNPGTSAQPVSLYFPCGDGTHATTFVITSTGDGAAIKIDDVYVGEAYGEGSGSNGAPGYIPIDYTPASTQGFGTPTFNYSKYQCSGGVLNIWFSITMGTTTAAEARYALPAGYTWADSAAITIVAGSFGRSVGSGTNFLTAIRPGTAHFNFTRFDGSSAATNLLNGSDIGSSGQVITGFISGSVSASSPCAQTAQTFKVDAPGVMPTNYVPAIEGAGTVTNNSATWQCIAPSMVYAGGRFTAGTVSAAEARIPLPPSFTSADSSQIPLLRISGGMVTSAVTATSYQTLIEPSVTYLTVGFQNGSTAGLDKKNGNVVWATGNVISWFAIVPVTSNSPCAKTAAPLYVGAVTTSSAGVERLIRVNVSGSSGVANCTASPCTIETSNVPGATATRAGTGDYLVTLPAGTLSAKGSCACSAQSVGISGYRTICSSLSTSATGIQIVTHREDTGGVTDAYVQVQCTGPK